MSSISADIQVNLRDGVSPVSRTMGRSLTDLQTRGQQSFQGLASASQRAEGQLKATAAQMNATRMQSISTATSIAGLGASFVALETTMTNIPKRLKAIEQAEVALARVEDTVAVKTVTLERLQLSLTKARQSGKKTAQEIKLIEDKIGVTRQQLGTYTADLAVKQEDLNLKHADYADTLKLMASSIFITFLTAGATVGNMLTNMATQVNMTTGAFIKSKLATIGQTNALKVLRIDLAGASLAFKGMAASMTLTGAPSLVAVTGIRRVSLAIKGLWLALGPLGWGIIGLVAAFEAWNHNLFGVRDGVRWLLQELQKLWKYLKWIIPVVGLVDEAFKRWDPEGHAKTVEGFTEGINNLGKETEYVAESADQLTEQFGNLELAADQTLGPVHALTGGMTTLSAVSGGLKSQTDGLYQSITNFHSILQRGKTEEKFAERIDQISLALTYARDNFDLTSLNGRKALLELHDEAKKVIDDFVELGAHDLAENALTNFEKLGVFGSKQMQDLASSIKSVSTEIDTLKKNYDNTVEPISNIISGGRLRSEQEQYEQFRRDSINARIRQAEFIRKSQSSQAHRNDLTAIAEYNSRTQNNYADPNFRTGGGFTTRTSTRTAPRASGSGRRSGGSGVGQYAAQRRQARMVYDAANERYYEVFGIYHKINHLPRRGVTSTYLGYARRLDRAVEDAKNQLAQFPVELDYAPRLLRTKVGVEKYQQWWYSANTRRLFNRTRDVFKNLVRTPTKNEAVRRAIRQSERKEEAYEELVNLAHGEKVSTKIKTEAELKKILAYNTVNDQAEQDILNRWSYEARILLEANTS